MATLNLSCNLSRRYRYRLRADYFAGAWKYSYELIGARGGVHLHVSGPHKYENRDNWSLGLEVHWRFPPPHMIDQPPSHDKCWLLNTPCWHDGTSIYAEERYLHHFLAGNHDLIFHLLVEDADSKLGCRAQQESA